MLKKVGLVVLQLLLFLVLFGAGSFLPVFTSLPAWQVHAGPNSVFILDGLLLTLAVYLVILAVEVATKRLRDAGNLTTLALLLAVALGLAVKFGFKSI